MGLSLACSGWPSPSYVHSPPPTTTTSRRAMEEEQKYHWRARYISSYFDASPKCVKEVERVLRLDENVLRFFTLRPKTQADLIRTRSGFRAAVWAEKRTPEMVAEKARETKAKLFHE